jgi:hypothetical protein
MVFELRAKGKSYIIASNVIVYTYNHLEEDYWSNKKNSSNEYGNLKYVNKNNNNNKEIY